MELVAKPSPPSAASPAASTNSAHCRYYYTSAPTSPSRTAVYADLYATWEEKPASPKPSSEAADDFSFCFYGKSEGEWPIPPLATADELFEEGMIRPLIPSTHRETSRRDRGRTLVSATGDASSRGRRASRSLSPLRGGGGEEEPTIKSPTSSSVSPIKSGGSRKWRLKDLFLFRSASEGRAAGGGGRDALAGYAVLPCSSSSLSANLHSAHEMYYTANRAAAELKKKTPLPYHRQGLFGCIRFNPGIDGIKKGFSGSLFSRK